MNAGILRHRPVFESPTLSQDADSGAEVKTWPPTGGTAVTLPADFQYVGSREFPARDKQYAETTARVIVRYSVVSAAVNVQTDRIKHDGKIWEVTGMMPDSRHTQIIFEVNEIK